MSKFRIPISVNIIDILWRRIGRKSRINSVRHRASGRVSHIRLTVLFWDSEDIQIRCESVTERVRVNVVSYPGFQTNSLQVHTEFLCIELEELWRFTFEHFAQTFGYFHPAHRAFRLGPVYLQPPWGVAHPCARLRSPKGAHRY